MGLTLLFHVSGESSLARHKAERRSRYLEAIGAVADVEDAQDAEDAQASDSASSVEVNEEADNSDGSAEANNGEPASMQAKAGDVDADFAELEESLEKASLEEDDLCAEDNAVNESGQVVDDTTKMEVASEENLETEVSTKSGRTRMSKAAQRKMKKGEPATESSKVEKPAEFKPPQQESNKTAAAPKPLPRGQKAKQQKIKAKYAEQDEDERDLRMTLLGSKVSKHVVPTSFDNADEDACEADSSCNPQDDAATPPNTRTSAQSATIARTDAASKDAQGSKGKGKGGKKKPEAAVEEVQRAGCEFDESAEFQPDMIDVLTGQPHAEDEVMYAIPMVAPYCSLGGPYVLRAKLTPGPTKKGAAAKTCLKMFETQLEQKQWKQMVQAVPEADTAGFCVVLAKCQCQA